MNLGDYVASGTVDFLFTSINTTGAPTTMSGTPAISIYKANGATESTAGVTVTKDFDSRTGLNHCRISLSADGTFYAAGSDYHAVITTGSIGGTSVVGYRVAEFSIQNRSALRPTVAGRTLDVSAGGEAGVDWANVGSPTTTVGLSGTTVKTATDVETDTADIQSRIPAALVSGRIDASVGAMAAGTVTAAAIATDAIDADAIADNAIDAGAIATGAITSAKFAAGAIDAAAIAANAIGASELAADAVAEIADAVWDEASADHVASGSFGWLLRFVKWMTGNRVTHSGTTVTVYQDDDTTSGLTYQLKNSSGTALNSSAYASTAVAERTAAE